MQIMKRKNSFYSSLGIVLLAIVLALNIPFATQATELEKEADSLRSQLSSLQTELSQTATAIETTAAEIEQQKIELSEAEVNKEKQYEDMKLRIKYMYENNPYSMLQMIVESETLATLQANIEYVQAITEYDNEMFEKFSTALEEVETKDAALQEKRNELSELQTSLEMSIQDAQKALTNTNAAIQQERQQAALEEALAKAKELEQGASGGQANVETPSGDKPSGGTTQEPPKEENPGTGSGTGSSTAIYTLSQFLRAGVINWNGYKFTYYSQSVLPGNSLNIPGRHVNADGYVSDGSGYICLAGSAPFGTVYDTPFGYQGKIYDRGTSGNHLDVYIR